MDSLHRFFLFCAGTDASILDQCRTDRHKYAGIGATVFFTGVLAFFSSGYALYTVFGSVFMAIIFGLIWGLMIFNLDRYIVMSMKSQGKWWRDFFVAFPRAVLAILLALVISKPLEMKIFEKEIHAEVVQMEQEVYKQQEDRVKDRFTAPIADHRAQIAALKAEIAKRTATRDTLSRIAQQEADGTGGSRHQNLGPIYRAKKADADAAAKELADLMAIALPQITQHEAEIAALEAKSKVETSSLDRTAGYDGLAARMEALSRLGAKSRAIALASLFIMLLFIAIETAPIVVKLISPRSPYDYILQEHEHVFEMENLEKVTLRNNAVKNKLRFDTETSAHYTNESITAEKTLIEEKIKEKLAGMKGKPYQFGMMKE